MTAKIIEALQKLDTANDNHWTADGLPRIDTVKMLASDQTLTRDTITAAAPNFSRTNADLTGATTTPTTPETTPASENSAGTSQEGVKPLVEGLQAAKEAVQDAFANPEVQEGIKTLAEALTDWDALHAAAKEKQEAAQQVFNEAKQALAEANHELDIVVNAMPEGKKETPTDAIQGYLASQQRQAEEKAQTIKELQESGVDVDHVRALLGQAENIKALTRNH